MIEFNVICEVGGTPTLCDMKYDPAKPAEMSMTFHHSNSDDSIEWIISRELFKNVLETGDAGEGEVLMNANHECVKVVFISPHGKGLAIYRRDVIEDFVNQVYTLVPDGQDIYDMSDKTLQNWLDSFA